MSDVTLGTFRGYREYTEQMFGVEIEVEGVHTADWAFSHQRWTVTHDGSLRNNGQEFITPPLNESDMRTAISEFYSEFRQHGYETSQRTGIHVHADMSMCVPHQLRSILTAYVLAEPALFTYCGPDREQWIYCVPWYRAPEDMAAMAAAFNDGRWRRVCRVADETCKYGALYCEPLNRFGTIEFRHAETFTDERQMQDWLSIVSRLLRYGAARTPDVVLAEFYSRGPDAWLQLVFGDLCDRMRNMLGFEGLYDTLDVETLADIMGSRHVTPAGWDYCQPEEAEGSIGYYQDSL